MQKITKFQKKKVYISRYLLNDKIISILIIANTVIIILMSFDSFIIYTILDIILTIIFVFEMIFKIIYNSKFFKSKYNVFDLIIVSLCLISLLFFSIEYLIVLRILRIFKSLRLFRVIPNFHKLIINLKIAIKSSIGIIIGGFIFILILSIILTAIFSNVVPEYFGNPFDSIYTVFRLFTIEGWYEIPEAISNNTNYYIGMISKYIISLIVLFGGIFGMSFVNSVFVDEMASDNNDEVLNQLQEIKQLLNKIQNEKTETRF